MEVQWLRLHRRAWVLIPGWGIRFLSTVTKKKSNHQGILIHKQTTEITICITWLIQKGRLKLATEINMPDTGRLKEEGILRPPSLLPRHTASYMSP